MIQVMFRVAVFVLVLGGGAALGADRPAGESAGTSYTLGQVIEFALERHPALAGAQGVIEQGRGQQVAAGAYPNPTIGGNGGRGEIRDVGRADIRQSLTTDSLTEVNVTVGQPLEWPAMRAARKRVAEAGLAMAGAGLSEARLNLVADVKIAFYELLLAQQVAELAAQNRVLVGEVARKVESRVKSGEAPQFEAIKAQVEVLKASQQVALAHKASRVSRIALDTLTAGALGADYYLIQGEFSRFPAGASHEALVARGVERHPTLQRLRKSVEQAGHKIEFEQQARVPTVTVNGSYWREIGREAYQAGVTVPTPFWYQRQGEVVQALGARRKEEAEWWRTRNELVRAIGQHFQEAETTTELLTVFERGLLKQAQEALRLAEISFLQGYTSLLEVLDAQRVLRQIQLDYAQAQFHLSVSLARLEWATGGNL